MNAASSAKPELKEALEDLQHAISGGSNNEYVEYYNKLLKRKAPVPTCSCRVLRAEVLQAVRVEVSSVSQSDNPGAQELKEAYMLLYGFDYQKACCHLSDFDFEVLD